MCRRCKKERPTSEHKEECYHEMILDPDTPEGVGRILLLAADHGQISLAETGRELAILLFGLGEEAPLSAKEVAVRLDLPLVEVERFIEQAKSVAKGMQIAL